MIKKVIRQTPGYDLLYKIRTSQRNRRVLQQWRESGEPIPPPSVFKETTVKEYARRFGLNTLIETGTCYGDMIFGVKDSFERIYSIELSEELASHSRNRFSRYPHVEIIHGDSANVLPQLLSSISSPCLMWLDAHYSRGITARGQSDTPITHELETIFETAPDKSCVLIDDARLFVGQDAYPTLQEVEAAVKERRADWAFEVKHDIIRIHPRRQ